MASSVKLIQFSESVSNLKDPETLTNKMNVLLPEKPCQCFMVKLRFR